MEEQQQEISLGQALLPVIILVLLLAFNVFVFGDDALGGSNQFILLIGAAVAAVVGFTNKVHYDQMLEAVGGNLKSTTGAILILLFVGALAGTWLLSGIIPAMIYYGLQILHPSIFLPACIVICAIISLATGSSWTTLFCRDSSHWNWSCLRYSRRHGSRCGHLRCLFWDKLSPLVIPRTWLRPWQVPTCLPTFASTYTTIPSIVITLVVFSFWAFQVSGKPIP